MKVELARSVINTDDVDSLIEQWSDRHPKLKKWLQSNVRNWILKSAPATPSVLQTTEGLPDWLKHGDAVAVDLEKLQELVPSVIDYVEYSLEQKPNLALRNLGFAQAIKNSEAWHKKLANKKQKSTVEPGSKVVMEFPDGYFWVELASDNSMKNEGARMGHCVGDGGYHRLYLLGKITIYSLRDSKNEPHITMDVDPSTDTVSQIKGKANTEIKPEYLPYLFEFLKKNKWSKINFDKGTAIREQYLTWLKETAKEYDGFKIYVPPVRYKMQISVFGKNLDESVSTSSLFITRPVFAKAIAEFLKDHPKIVDQIDKPMVSSMRWLRLVGAPEFLAVYFGTPNVMMWGYAYCADNDVFVDGSKEDEYKLTHLPLEEHGCGYGANSKVYLKGEFSERLTKILHAAHAGAAVQISDNPVDALLSALRLPSMLELEKTANSKPDDDTFDEHRIPIGGTSVTATALVIALCLNKDKRAAKEYLENRPNAMRNWQSIIKGELPVAFAKLDFSSEQQVKIVTALRKLYERLQ